MRQRTTKRSSGPTAASCLLLIAGALMLMNPAPARAKPLDSQLDLGVGYGYSGQAPLKHLVSADGIWMLFLGSRHAWCLGASGQFGLSGSRVAYQSDAMFVGYQLRGWMGTTSVCAGTGIRGASGGLPPPHSLRGGARPHQRARRSGLQLWRQHARRGPTIERGRRMVHRFSNEPPKGSRPQQNSRPFWHLFPCGIRTLSSFEFFQHIRRSELWSAQLLDASSSSWPSGC